MPKTRRFARLWRPLSTKRLPITLQCTRAFSKYPLCTIKRHENFRSTSYHYGGAALQKSFPKLVDASDFAFSLIFFPFFRLRPPSTKCLKGSPYQKNVLANVVGHRKHMEGGWCFFTSSFIYGLQGPSNVFGLKFRPTSLRFVPSFQQTPRTRGLNGKNYRKTLRVLIVGLLETIRCGLFFSQNIRKYGH